MMLGYNFFYLGEYTAPGRTWAGGRPHRPAVQRLLVLAVAGVWGDGLAVQPTLWCLGYPAQAMQRSQEALALAQELAHPYSLAVTQVWAAYLHYRRRRLGGPGTG